MWPKYATKLISIYELDRSPKHPVHKNRLLEKCPDRDSNQGSIGHRHDHHEGDRDLIPLHHEHGGWLLPSMSRKPLIRSLKDRRFSPRTWRACLFISPTSVFSLIVNDVPTPFRHVDLALIRTCFYKASR
jgi:hypothetical protein